MRARLLASMAAASVAAAGCSAGPGGPGFRPSYHRVPCPADAAVQLVVPHSCGYLTVLQDRSKPAGLRVKVFVVKIVPPGARLPADPVLSFGNDVGFGEQVGGTAPLAARVGRIAYLMDPRGTGHSLPSLACPEVNQLAPAGLAAPAGDTGLLHKFLAAVTACRTRLTRRGINPAAYDLAAVAADAKDLRQALGIREWDLASYGSYSGALLQTLRLDPGGVRAAFIDSPVFPQADPLTGAAGGMGWALGQLFTACRQDQRCAHTVPGLAREWSQALDRLDRHPIQAKLPGPGSAVTIDGGKLVLAVRSALGTSGSTDIGWLPAAISAAAAGRVNGQLLALIEAQPAVFEDGYQPGEDDGPFSLGGYLSTVCRDQAPFATGAALSAAAAANRAFDVFTANPYRAACRVWDVPPAGQQMHQAVKTPVPILVLTGQFDAFSPTPVAQAAAKSFTRAWVIQVPWQIHDVLGGNGCALTIRNNWLNAPTHPPDTACMAAIKPPPFQPGTR
jgi:pimeloyl-ACP methyl ester carboxylesterase